MTTEKEINNRYWKAKKNQILKDQYHDFLKNKGLQASPHSAHIFAMHVHQNGLAPEDMSEREIILVVHGSLPEHYD